MRSHAPAFADESRHPLARLFPCVTLLGNSGPLVACAAARRNLEQSLIVVGVGDAPTPTTMQPNAASYRKGGAVMFKRTIITLGFLAIAGSAQAGTTLNALSVNALNPNALTENALTENALTDNAIAYNALTENTLTQNALTENAIFHNALVDKGARVNALDAEGIGMDATRVERSRHDGLRVVDVELPAASTNEK
jgi:hypothetical protein